VRGITEDYNRKFNPRWGQLFKAGLQDSRFAKQVCLVDSHSNTYIHIHSDEHVKYDPISMMYAS
jgi:hypothetical protein